ncbi:FecCD family ABC transporter permease [Sulfurimonas marina]|uniref:Iron ABC transporter permease n=1 Tax=Sulfurimonas marina TaxID=2590551 RepID=A0A7M3V957_9BACT|nr:iron ABC transporter permease [Sulfurimonas marina]QOP40290.1 iron ABC transporter permease [Sulfurimonas marina]
MKTLFILLSLIVLALAPFFGQIELHFDKLNELSTVDHMLFFDLRLPRVIIAFFSGALLGLSGLIFQSLFRNPMSTPFTLGVASGATLGTAFAIVFGFVSFAALFGFVGAIMTIVILFAITSRLKNYEISTLLLVGIALSFFYSAALMILFYLSDETQSYEIVRFTMGSLDIVGLKSTLPVVIASLILLGIAVKFKKEIQILLTSYDNAFLKGIEVKKVSSILLLVVSIAIGVTVSVVGPIGFVGLIVPHILKIIYKKSADKLLGVTFFYSGIFLVLCDLIARNLGASSDIPIGVITSFLGGPFFIYLLVSRRRS